MPEVEIDGGGGQSQSTPDPGGMPSENLLEGPFVPQPPPAAAPPPPSGGGGGGGGGGGYRPPPSPAAKPAGKGANYPIGSYTSLTGDPAHGAVPAGEYNVLEALMGEWEALTGYTIEPSDAMLLEMANGGIQTLGDFGGYMKGHVDTSHFPWANNGLTKDEYVSAATIYGTTYKEITGSEIPPEALEKAFQNPRDRTGGYLTASQYKNQLMNDAAIQKSYGWVKYGLDYSAWTQSKLQMHQAFGRDINDAEAATILQYHKAATGPNMSAVARQSGQQAKEPAGISGSFAR